MPYALPAPAYQLTFIDLILKTALDATQALNFAYCATDPSDSSVQQASS